ncbi:MAG: cupin domain-containing protein, partial [Desulfurococcales archaeon]|nr:cupin domain-containing protein [Desulfurococcales archaeon]
MPCGEKVTHYTSVPEEPVPEEMATGTTIRWLISDKDGASNFYMRMFRMEPGAHIKAHFHPWEHEIYVLEGSGR